MATRLALPAALLAAALTLGACGDDDTESASRAAPPASAFPPAKGRTLLQVLNSADAEGPVIAPAGQVYRPGENRYSFGVFDVGGDQITDADASKVAYATEIDFDQPGEWRIGALVSDGDSLQGSLTPSAVVSGRTKVPDVGDKAPVAHTPTADDVGDLSEIDTRDPPDTMHEDDLADVLGKEPVVLLFASPALCRSRTCGPVVDVAEQLKDEYGDEVAFIHVEPYEDNVIDKGASAPAQAYGLSTEPWLFVIDRDGVVRTAIKGAFS